MPIPVTPPSTPAGTPDAGPPARHDRPAAVGAAIDIGAHSVHLLVAEVRGHDLAVHADESVVLGLGAVVAASGEIGPDAAAQLEAVLGAQVRHARQLGATALQIVATDPLRRAADGRAVAMGLGARLQVDIEVLRAEEEALLALIGAQAGRPIRRAMALVDIGGGSTEVLVVGPSGEARIAALPIGASRLGGSQAPSGSPSAADIDRLLADARAAVRDAPDARILDLVAVGGTASNLLRVGPPLKRSVLSTSRINRALAILAAHRAEEISRRYGVKPARARVLPGGAAILLAVAERYERERIRVSAAGIREGVVLASGRTAYWRGELAVLARGWRG